MRDWVRNGVILGCLGLLIALPFLFRRDQPGDAWQPGDPVLVAISPHNEAIRMEFAYAFSAWHAREFGTPVRMDWRSIGGTTEIMRYLESEYTSSFRAWAMRNGLSWPGQAGMAAFDARFNPEIPPAEADVPGVWQQQAALWRALRARDDAQAFGAGIDLFFGGGTYDHGIAAGKGFSVPPWPAGERPEGLFTAPGGTPLIPAWVSGEQWWSDYFIGTCISTFGICSNRDRLSDLGIDSPPRTWRDLADPRLFRQVGVADPTKSGSIAKAFEMIIQQECRLAVAEAGFSGADIDRFEVLIAGARLPAGVLPPEVPDAYQDAIEQGWENGLNLVRLIGANARYFTDAAGKVPIDVSNGAAAAGIVIDFYGRYQAEFSLDKEGEPRLDYFTPLGGSSVSADPISLLRGAPNRDLAVRFIAFVLGPEGQKIWTYRPGTPGGPRRFALRRLPIRRDFYPAPDVPALHAQHQEHLRYSSDDLSDPAIDPYQLADTFTYYPRWTAAHFGVHRNLIRAMAMDAGDELQRAWQVLRPQYAGFPQTGLPAVLLALPGQPAPLTWPGALALHRDHDRLDLMRQWTSFFRGAYRQALDEAGKEAP
jgi:iron(III) transport system substrate-binding protein